MSRRKATTAAFSGLLTITLVAIIVAASAWDGRPQAAEARSIKLEGGVYAPVASPPGQVSAAIPSQVNFQGVLTDPSTGAAVPDGTYSIRLSVWDAGTAGTELWNETQPSVSVSGGLFNVQLGSANSFPANLFADAPRLLEVKVGADPAMTPRLPFLSVPYAFRAEIAHAATLASDLDCSVCVGPSELDASYAASGSPGGPASDVACLSPGCILGSEIVDGQVGTLDIQDNSIGSFDIAFDAVTSDDIAFNTIQSGDIADGTLTGTDISDFSGVASIDIVDAAITGTDISDTVGVASADIVNGTITGTDISDTSGVASIDIVDATILGTDIANATITGNQVQDSSLASADVQDNSLTATDVAINYAGSATEGGAASDVACSAPAGCVSGNEIVDAQVASADIVDATITSTDIADGAVTSTDITDGTVTGTDITTGTLTLSGTGVTLGPNTVFTYLNGDGGLGLSANGTDGDQFIYFFEGSPTGESLRWNNILADNRFEFSDDLHVGGNLTATNVNPSGNVSATGSVSGTSFSTSGTAAIGGTASIGGLLTLSTLGTGGTTQLCRNPSNQLADCSSSARYKDNIAALAFDGEKLLALRPVQFNWKDSGEPGVGLVAEEVADLIPELVTYNANGEVEGVKYDQLTVYLLELLKQHEMELAELRAASGESSVAPASTAGSFGAGDLALVLAVAVAAAAVISTGTTLFVTRMVFNRKGQAS